MRHKRITMLLFLLLIFGIVGMGEFLYIHSLREYIVESDTVYRNSIREYQLEVTNLENSLEKSKERIIELNGILESLNK